MEAYLALLIFAVATVTTPGPNNIMLLSSGLNYGLKPSLPHLMGVSLGFPVMVVGVGLGVGVLFQQYPFLHNVIQGLGVIYLLYLAYQIAIAQPVETGADPQKKSPMTFLQAFGFQWVNPKAWVMATSAVSSYTQAGPEVLWQIGMIACVFLVVTLPCVGIWLLGGHWLKNILTDIKKMRRFNFAMALLLILSVTPTAFALLKKVLVLPLPGLT